MKLRYFLTVFAVFISVFILDGCLTTGDRINMEEFKRQLQESKADMDAKQAADAEAYAEAAEEKSAETAKSESAAAAVNTAGSGEPTAVSAISVKAAADLPEEKVSENAEAKSQPTDEIPVKIQTEKEAVANTRTGNNYLWLLIAVFTGAFSLFVLIIYLAGGKKREKDEKEILPEPVMEHDVISSKQAVTDYSETALLRQTPAAGLTLPDKNAAIESPVVPIDENQVSAAAEIPDSFTETKASVDSVPPPHPQVPLPEKSNLYGEGNAGISPTQFAANSQGNAVHLFYKNGPDAVVFRTLKITVPEGWSRPGLLKTDEGYFTVTTNSGTVTSIAAEGTSMLITIQGLSPDTGEVAVVYGERRGGNQGVKVQPQPGEAVFKIETESRGTTELKEIEDSPVVDVN